jgi:hypothetical protein
VDHPPIGSGQAQPGDARMRLEIEMSAERPYYREFAWACDLLQTDLAIVQGSSERSCGRIGSPSSSNFAVWLKPGGIAIFDVREWARAVARYEKHSIHERTVSLPDGTLHFKSKTVLDSELRQMRIRECFKVSRNDIETSNVNGFVMGAGRPRKSGCDCSWLASMRRGRIRATAKVTGHGLTG